MIIVYEMQSTDYEVLPSPYSTVTDIFPSTVYFCKTCHQMFTDYPHMLQHYISVHDNEKKYVCRECSHKFSTEQSKRKHVLHKNKREALYLASKRLKESHTLYQKNQELERQNTQLQQWQTQINQLQQQCRSLIHHNQKYCFYIHTQQVQLQQLNMKYKQLLQQPQKYNETLESELKLQETISYMKQELHVKQEYIKKLELQNMQLKQQLSTYVFPLPSSLPSMYFMATCSCEMCIAQTMVDLHNHIYRDNSVGRFEK